MANGTLNFSVIFSAVTQAFNTGVKGAAQNYQQATSSITGNSEEMGRATQALQGKLTDVFQTVTLRSPKQPPPPSASDVSMRPVMLPHETFAVFVLATSQCGLRYGLCGL